MFKSFFSQFISKSESGIAMVQVLVLGALLSGAITFSVLQNSKASKQISHNIYNQDLRNLVDRIQSVLANEVDCTDMIAATTGFSTLATSASISPTSLAGTNLRVFLQETDAVTLVPRYGSQEKISLTDITITRGADNDGAGTLLLNFRIDDDVLGIREFAKSIPIIMLGTAATVTSCHANPDDIIADAVQRFCHGPGAIYKEETNQCFIIGVNATDCDSGEYVRGLAFDPATLMMNPVCETPTVASYDEVGCYGLATVPTGLDGSGDIVCSTMTSSYIWDLVFLNQQNAAFEICSSNIAKLSYNVEGLRVRCQAATPTPLPTDTPTAAPSNTPPGATPSPTSTFTPIPTYTPTSSSPTNTPTPCGGGEQLSGVVSVEDKPLGASTLPIYPVIGQVSYNIGGGSTNLILAGPGDRHYAFEVVETGVDTDSVDVYDNTGVPADPASMTVDFVGSTTGTPVCDCNFAVRTTMDHGWGIQNVDNGLWDNQDGIDKFAERLSRYTLSSCNMTGTCTATRAETYDCLSGTNSSTLKRQLVGGVHKGERGTSDPDYNVCIDPTAESRWVYTLAAESVIYSMDDNTIEACVSASSVVIDDCTCAGGTLSESGYIVPVDLSPFIKTYDLEVDSWTD